VLERLHAVKIATYSLMNDGISLKVTYEHFLNHQFSSVLNANENIVLSFSSSPTRYGPST
jgi:hypothetical protein